MCVNAHGRARLREQIVARKVVDRGGPDEIDATVPRLREDRLEGDMHGPPTKPWLMPASPVLHADDGSHGEAGVSPRALRCSIHQRAGLRHGHPARPGCGSSGRTVRIHEPASPESVRCEPRRRAGHLAPEGPRVRRSRFRHGGYLLPKGSGVHETGQLQSSIPRKRRRVVVVSAWSGSSPQAPARQSPGRRHHAVAEPARIIDPASRVTTTAPLTRRRGSGTARPSPPCRRVSTACPLGEGSGRRRA